MLSDFLTIFDDESTRSEKRNVTTRGLKLNIGPGLAYKI